jgi:hypothetical protein
MNIQVFFLFIGFILCILISIVGLVLGYTFIYVRCNSSNTNDFINRMNDLSEQWILLKPFSFLVQFLANEPSIPTDGIVYIGNCKVYLANVPHKLSKKRLNLELLCLIDLYYHEKRIQQGLGSPQITISVAISQETYIQSQWMIRSGLYGDFQKKVHHFIQDYIKQIRWTSDLLHAYRPESSYIYFSC